MRALATLHKPSAREESFIRRGRAAFEQRFPDQDFDGGSWSIQHLKKSAASQGNTNLYFTHIDNLRHALPKRYADPIKAHMAICGKAPGSLYNQSTAIRWLWEAVLERLRGERDAFCWEGLTKEDVENAEQKMIASGMGSNSVYRRCVDLMSVLNDLSDNGVISVLSPDFESVRQDSLDRQTLDGMEDRAKHMPTDEAISGMAEVYRKRHSLGHVDRLCACVTAIMFASSLRVVEVLQLTVDCLRQEGSKWFLYFIKAKDHVEDKIPLSVSQAALAKEAIDDVIALTIDARHRAKVLASSPDTVPLPGTVMEQKWLPRDVVADLLGIKPTSIYPLAGKVAMRRGADGLLINRASLQKYLQTVRIESGLGSTRGFAQGTDGKWLPLDKAIFLIFLNRGHAARGTNPLLVELLTWQMVRTFLGGHTNGLPSIFERLGVKEKNGTFVSMNPHQIRHYVTSKAASAGIPDTYLARWQRRRGENELQAYKHLTREERIRQLKTQIKNGSLQGEISTMYFALAESERDVFLDHIVQAVHLTHFGFCIHDFNVSPCPKALNCIGCGSFLFDQNDPSQRDQILRLLRGTERALEDAVAAQTRGEGVLVHEWVAMMKATIEGLRTTLKVKPRIGIKLVAPFDGQPSKFQPLV